MELTHLLAGVDEVRAVEEVEQLAVLAILDDLHVAVGIVALEYELYRSGRLSDGAVHREDPANVRADLRRLVA